MTGKTITLETPIMRGETKLEQVAIIKPVGCGWLRGVKLFELLQIDSTALSTVLPRVTEPPLTQLEVQTKLDPVDLLQMGAEVSSFLLKKSDLMETSREESNPSGPILQ